MNDCTTGIHNCDVNGICTNRIGSFSCKCSDLYRDVSDEFGHKCKGNGLLTFFTSANVRHGPWIIDHSRRWKMFRINPDKDRIVA